MQWLLNLLNGDFLSGATSPHVAHVSDAEQDTVRSLIAEGKITQEQARAAASSRDDHSAVMDATERAEARRLQALMVHHLTPVLGLDPHELLMQRRKTMEVLLRQAERRGRPKEARELRRQLGRDRQGARATKERTQEEGLRGLVCWLTEWAQGERLDPWWQIKTSLPDDLSLSTADQQYRIGAKVYTVTQWPGRPKTLTAKGMLNLGACLASGELNRLRVCNMEACGRFFYAEDLRSEVCSDACRRRKDGPSAVGRMRRMRKKRDAAARALFLDTIPTLRVAQFRALEDQCTPDKRALALLDDLVQQFPSLNDGELALLGDLVKQSKDGRSLPYLWKQPRVRRLFKKVTHGGRALL